MCAREAALLLLGGTGFIGRSLAETLRAAGFVVAVAGRQATTTPGMMALPPCDLAAADFRCERLLAPLDRFDLRGIVNLVPGDARATASVLRLVERARTRAPRLRFVHVGSIAELTRAIPPSPYARSKRAAWRAIAASRACDYRLLLGVVSDGNPRMARDLARFDPIVSQSRLLLDGFALPCIERAAVGRYLAAILQWPAPTPAHGGAVEIRLPHQWRTLRELRRACLGEEITTGRPRRFERQRLRVREAIERWRARRDPSRARLAHFCRLARLSGTSRQRAYDHYSELRLPDDVQAALAAPRDGRVAVIARGSVWYVGG